MSYVLGIILCSEFIGSSGGSDNEHIGQPNLRKRVYCRFEESQVRIICENFIDKMISEMLMSRRVERDALLKRAIEAVECSPEIGAAWMFGSLGRGDEDDLSDIDLFLVVADESLDRAIADRYAFMARISPPLLVLEAPQNRPPGGAYNMALYPGSNGPLQVDWYWQPQSEARIPTQTHIIFDHIGLPRLDTPPQFEYQPVPEQTQIEFVRQAVHFFWVMLLITAKHAARSPQQDRMDLLKWVYAPLLQVREYLGASGQSFSEDTVFHQSADKMQILRELASEMEALMPHIDIDTPTAIVPQARLFLNLVEAVLRENCLD